MRVFCDFDGTVTVKDTTDLILGRFADSAWESIETEWTAGTISAAECMTRQVALIRASREELDAVLDQVELRDGFTDFLVWAGRRGVPVSIVSDGIDYFIRRILSHHGLYNLPVVANRLVSARGHGWALEQPWRRSSCGGGSGVCKCSVVGAFGDDRPLVFIGDGRSDFCVSRRPDRLFATAGLARFCEAEGIAYQPFASFADVRAALEDDVIPAGRPTVLA